MIIFHAPYALLGDLVILYGKTTKTACGKRRVSTELVSRETTNCIECQEAIKADRAEMEEMKKIVHGAICTKEDYTSYQEVMTSECVYGCKYMQCEKCGIIVLVHNSTYGCPEGKSK